MQTLVKDLLDLSRVEADTIELDTAEVDIQQLVTGALESMNPIFDAKFQVVTHSKNLDLHTVSGDLTRLNQVVVNLLSNASKYSPEGSTVDLATSNDESNAVIKISDRGIGISEEDQQELFTPFFRPENSETRQVSGNGLGLVICKQIVELHGGSLTIESKRGQGTSVTVVLPLLTENENEVSAA